LARFYVGKISEGFSRLHAVTGFHWPMAPRSAFINEQLRGVRGARGVFDIQL
jgi:hypothetical protein